ncbi:hypothetical protein ACFO0N_04470 [Halobium salinum]|uniref:Uncharacterized protein n=1 Tax=Halobium salinum TaxID=1364940 RepID=A0ABD5P8I6_9EURY|nr:hypothetical protein [Halobium salinum]
MSTFRGLVFGVVVALLVESALFLALGYLTPVGGLLGSAVAGRWADGSVRRGAAVGLAVAVAWGVPLVVAAAYLALATGEPTLWLFSGVVRTVDPALAVAIVVLGLTLPNALVGAGGAFARRDWETGLTVQ